MLPLPATPAANATLGLCSHHRPAGLSHRPPTSSSHRWPATSDSPRAPAPTRGAPTPASRLAPRSRSHTGSTPCSSPLLGVVAMRGLAPSPLSREGKELGAREASCCRCTRIPAPPHTDPCAAACRHPSREGGKEGRQPREEDRGREGDGGMVGGEIEGEEGAMDEIRNERSIERGEGKYLGRAHITAGVAYYHHRFILCHDGDTSCTFHRRVILRTGGDTCSSVLSLLVVEELGIFPQQATARLTHSPAMRLTAAGGACTVSGSPPTKLLSTSSTTHGWCSRPSSASPPLSPPRALSPRECSTSCCHTMSTCGGGGIIPTSHFLRRHACVRNLGHDAVADADAI